jgi:hypothetical protein
MAFDYRLLSVLATYMDLPTQEASFIRVAGKGAIDKVSKLKKQ